MIFGVNGQDGYYLSQWLQQKGYTDILGYGRPAHPDDMDITDLSKVSTAIQKHQPAFIFHLAANSTTRHEALFDNHATISTGALNILESVRLHSPHTRVFISGSGLQFVNNGNPIDENTAFEARDAYSVSRIHSVYAARYFRSLGVKAYVGYLFNHDSPLRSVRHVSKKISAAAKEVAAGKREKIEIGDIRTVKEWTFAGDVVKAIWTLVNNEDHFEAVIGSGQGYSIQDWLELCFGKLGLHWEDHVSVKKDFIPEYDRLISRPDLIKSMGWSPEVSFSSLADMMLNS
jgi:GDPmannose 4,6-dehydratase